MPSQKKTEKKTEKKPNKISKNNDEITTKFKKEKNKAITKMENKRKEFYPGYQENAYYYYIITLISYTHSFTHNKSNIERLYKVEVSSSGAAEQLSSYDHPHYFIGSF